MINKLLSSLLAFWKTESNNKAITIEVDDSEETTENHFDKIH